MAEVQRGSNFEFIIDSDEIDLLHSGLNDALDELVNYCEAMVICAPLPSIMRSEFGFMFYRETRVKDWEQRRYRRQGRPRRKR